MVKILYVKLHDHILEVTFEGNMEEVHSPYYSHIDPNPTSAPSLQFLALQQTYEGITENGLTSVSYTHLTLPTICSV